jgi:hypothetical protein
MKPLHLLFSLVIVACAAVAWFILGTAIRVRTASSSNEMSRQVRNVWGPQLVQQHPAAWFDTPNAPDGRAVLQPAKSDVGVDLEFDPKRRGLLWHRTYQIRFRADYLFTNPTRIPQTIYICFPLPANAAGLHEFDLKIGDGKSDAKASASGPAACDGSILRAVLVPAGASVPLHVSYRTRGTGSWRYEFPDPSRISGFRLAMHTDFEQVNYPTGTGSPSGRTLKNGQWDLVWDYPDVLSAPNIGMDMPKLLNAGPVASRIAFFAPVSLLFFVAVLLIIAGIKRIPLHPMHIFFVSAGFFSFQLLFAYLVDLLPLYPSFAIAAVVSVVLVCGYLRAVGGRRLLAIALPAQIAYMVLFSASFFFDGLTGITIAIGAVATLALLMFLTAKLDWRGVFSRSPEPPPLETA